MRILLWGAILFLGLNLDVQAQSLKNEKLVVAPPQGYKLGHQVRKDGLWMTEMVPKSETVLGWTEMVTAQIFFGRSQLTPQKFRDNISQAWKGACPQSGFTQFKEGTENGYAFSYFLLSCPLNPKSNKPEFTSFKAIQGQENFYVVQKAWRTPPSKESLAQWAGYMDKVTVCDSRLKDRSC